MLDGENILEVGEDPVDQRCAEAYARDAQRPCPIMPEMGNWEQLQNMRQHDLPLPPWDSHHLPTQKGSQN